ncbi:MAG: hypothetical protein ACHQNA_00840 [Acidimicrobiales bacterium]
MNSTSPATIPITTLVLVGILLIVLGLFVGGEILLVLIGLASMAVAGGLGVLATGRSQRS